MSVPHGIRRLRFPMPVCSAALLLVLLSCLAVPPAAIAEEKPLLLPEVLTSVTSRYPPYLAALIEQDIANGRARQALGAFDLNISAGGTTTPAGFYDGRTGYAGLEQPLYFWGGSVYGGYRLGSGFLPNYNKDRTGVNGELAFGMRIPLLRDGTIDRRRATLFQARIDQELVDPIILRQYLDFVRAASIAYFNWLAAGHRLGLAEELLRIAKDRDNAIAEQVKNGASAPIVQVDNQRLVVSREIAVVQSLRRLQARAIELSLFYRTLTDDQPIVPDRNRVPRTFPTHIVPYGGLIASDIEKAVRLRPEVRRIALTIDKVQVDRRLAKNNFLPNLDFALQGSQSVGGEVPKDIEKTEIEARFEFKLPLQRREAKGALESAEAQIARLQYEMRFAGDRVTADVRDSISAINAAYNELKQTRRNVELSQIIEDAEVERVKLGATDLLALQIREQNTFDAKVVDVEAHAEYFRSQANYRAAIAADAPASLLKDISKPPKPARPAGK